MSSTRPSTLATSTSAATGVVVHVRAFAAARAALGWTERDVTAATVGDLIDLIADGVPGAADVLSRCSVLVEGARAGRTTQLPEHATVDLLPPFAGG